MIQRGAVVGGKRRAPRWALTAALLAAGARAHLEYVAMNPNGANVPGTEAIGHERASGGGPTNAYGNDFNMYGGAWGPDLCQADSDGDGFRNGFE